MFPSLKPSKNKGRDKLPASSTDIATTNNVSTGSMLTPPQPLVPAAPSSTPSMAFPENLYVNQRRYSKSTDSRFDIQTISNPVNAEIDIWFVHGLTGDRESTWKHSNGTFTPDLICAQFPTARVITYGYDANVIGLWENESGEGLRGHGKALAYTISNSRPNEVKRPIFFISHSLGGLVTQQALPVSLEPSESRLHSIARCTAGIIFMGTPHAMSYLTTWGYTLAKLLNQFWTTNKGILSVLKQKSEVLRGVEEVFQRQLTASGALNHVNIFCFYETVPVNVVRFVVPEESATILPYPNCGINANHMDMTKFTSLNDAGFISIKGVLDDWIKQEIEQPTGEIHGRSNDAASAMTLTFNNGPIKADVVRQGIGSASRDINHGNVTNQSAGRDWINRDQNLYGKTKGQVATDED